MGQITGKNINDCMEYLKKSDLKILYTLMSRLHPFTQGEDKILRCRHMLRSDSPQKYNLVINDKNNLFVVYGDKPILHSNILILKYEDKIIAGIDASDLRRKWIESDGEELEKLKDYIRDNLYNIIIFLGDKLNIEELNTYVDVIMWQMELEMQFKKLKN